MIIHETEPIYDKEYFDLIAKKHSKNIFFKSYPVRFTNLCKLLEKYQDKELETKLSQKDFFMLKLWIEDTYNRYTSSKDYTLYEKGQLLMNGITVIPNCKCAVKGLLH